MADRVVHLADISGGAAGVDTMLEQALEEIRDGLKATNGILVLAYQDGTETVTNVRVSGGALNVWQVIGLLELAKLHIALEDDDG